MIIKKTYSDNTYAIFKLLDIRLEFHNWWLKGLVLESDVDNIIPTNIWEFDLDTNSKFEVIEE